MKKGKPVPVYATARGSFAMEVSAHAAACANRCETEVAQSSRLGTGKPPRQVIEPIIRERLEVAFDAGVREGRSAMRAELEEVIRDAVARAVASISLEPAPCPHCVGGRAGDMPCEPCNGTGKRQPT